MQELLQYAIDLGWEQWLAVLFNVLYVILAARENILCWVFGLIGVSLLLFIYLDVKLYSDALLQVFYFAMSIYGWYNWKRQTNNSSLSIQKLPIQDHVGYLLIGTLAAVLLGFFWKYFGAALPFIDAFTTSFSVIATFLVARKILENWIYWIVIDSVCVYVYWMRDIPLIAWLFLFYTILAVYGWSAWRRRYRSQERPIFI